MIGFLPDKLIAPVCKRAGIQTEELCSKCGTKRVQKLAALLKNYKVHITGTKSFEASQVTAGGIPVQEIDPESMESKIVPGLYFAGEMIDVDAKCGGYNLQWAWASGYTAGKSIRAAETGMERCNTRKSKHSLKAIRNDKQYTY